MSDKLYPIQLPHLLQWILKEERTGSIFGVSKDLFFQPDPNNVFRSRRFGQLLESPIGVAAGPHTQMSQNIILAWLMGARYIELKTIQTLDELEVSKPCIDMQDEGYNCEWSQELKLQQSFSEYLNAWILIHILKDKFHWDGEEGLGTIFNMSAGYNLEGIKNRNVQQFLDLMENCQPHLDERLEQITSIYPKVKDIVIPSEISNNLTLSTMHGCPPDEIESIGKYFINERKYHTTIKLNPTLLGPDHLRSILNDHLGYNEITVPDEAFNHDLKYDDGVKLIRSLQTSAKKSGIDFGLKLTNTLEVENHKQVFQSNEAMMYMSGRALHPISIHVAEKLQTTFNGELDISFSAGTDAFNVSDVLACNIKPITVCTDLLKPGGYTRLPQYLNKIKTRFTSQGCSSIDEFILKNSKNGESISQSGFKYLQKYAKTLLDHPAYIKDNKHFDSIKTQRELTPFDCVQAPCTETCATDQGIPEYMYQVSQGNIDKAFDAILKTNPIPGITGHVCDHLCQMKCTRNNLDCTLLIRAIKRFVTENASKVALEPKPFNCFKTAVIGAGPSGLTCAYFLALEGFKVDVFESKPFSGGMVSDAIPSFRLTDDTIANDIDLIKSLGVNIHYNHPIDAEAFKILQSDYTYIYLAAGAQHNKKLSIDGENSQNVLEPLSFLSDVRRGKSIEVGEKAAVIGGGNTAMDAARTAKRLGADVTIIYRRTKHEMPADAEEITAALDEGINLLELTAPEKISNQNGNSVLLTCSKMTLGKPDESGRARPVKLDGSDFDMEFNTIIPAIGQDIAFDFLTWDDLNIDPLTQQTKIANVFAGGDAVRGASSVINAVGDGRKAALSIIQKATGENRSEQSSLRFNKFDYQKKLATRQFGMSSSALMEVGDLGFDLIDRTLTPEEAQTEASRCLQCDDICDICVSVCPNLANMSYIAALRNYAVYEILPANDGPKIQSIGQFSITQEPQIINIGDFCNECGNCTTFCPTSGDPYKTKPKFWLSKETFQQENSGYHLNGNILSYKNGSFFANLIEKNDSHQYADNHLEMRVDKNTLDITDIHLKKDLKSDTHHFARLAVLFENLKDNPLFNIENA